MAQPLQMESQTPENTFSHFGVLNTGSRSKGAAVTSITVNIVIALLLVILGTVAKTNPILAKRITELALPPEPKVQPVPKPPPPPPPPPKVLVDPPKLKMEPPKIKMPDPVVEPPKMKPIEVPVPKPMVAAPAPPKVINPAPAPKVVSLAAAAASVPNHDAHPTAVRLGSPDNPLQPLTGPAVARVNMGNAGMPGMNAANSGNGPHATKVSMGSGSPGGTDINGTGTRAVAGVKMGCIGCTGPLNSTNFSNAPKQVQLQTAQAVAIPHATEVHTAVIASPPKVTYKPTPSYTAEAKAAHVEGAVSIKIRVTAEGSVQVVSVTRGLGHGLDQSAIQAIEATRFLPAKDTTGRPIEWEGVVNVNFQMS